VPAGVPLIGPDTSPDAPREVPLGFASIEVTGTGRLTVKLAVGLSGPLVIVGAAGLVSMCPPAVVSIETSYTPLGELISGGTLRDIFTSLVYFTLVKGAVFNADLCRGIHPSIRPFNRSASHYNGVRRTHLSVA
jgi:hypothetical protein